MFCVKGLLTKKCFLIRVGMTLCYLRVFYKSLPQALLYTSLSTSDDVWHCRLGHPNPHILSLLMSNKKVSCTSKNSHFNYQSCPLKKSYCLSSELTAHKIYALFKLLLSDV
jgi:hypothetical protein